MSEEPENKTRHLHLLMAPSEVEIIDDWGFKNRIRTRAEAIRRLCQIGLTLDERADDLVNRALRSHEVAEELFRGVLSDDPVTVEWLVESVSSNIEIANGLMLLIDEILRAASSLKSERDMSTAITNAKATAEEIRKKREIYEARIAELRSRSGTVDKS